MNKLERIDWVPVYYCHNVSKVCHILTENITTALYMVALMIKIRNRWNVGKYIKQETMDLMEERDNQLK